jgi:hypothetical protein
VLTIPFFFPQTPAPGVFDSVVTEKTATYTTVTWECAETPGKACSLRIPTSEWGHGNYRYWPEQVSKGQLLKAVFFVGRLKSIPGCQERLAEEIKAYCQGLDCRPPINSLMPEDCARQQTAFIRELLERMKKQ